MSRRPSCWCRESSKNAKSQDDEATNFVTLLRSCAKNKDLCRGARVHDDILRQGLLLKCLDALVTMYAKCGDLVQAKDLFNVYKSRDPFTWTALIAGCAQKGLGHDALNYFEEMQHEGILPDAVTFTCSLKACGIIGAAEKGEKIHNEIAKQRLLGDHLVLGNALIDMYAKCGALAKALQVLEKLPVRDVISWNTLIAGYVQKGQGAQALNCFEWMKDEGIRPDEVTFICVLKACSSIGAADKGKRVHADLVKQGLPGNNIALGTAVVDMYSKCGAHTKAHTVLEELPVRDVITWNALIAGYVRKGEGKLALDCFESMQCEGLCPNASTFVGILKSCGILKAAEKGEKFHDDIAKRGLLIDNIALGNALVDMYAKCHALAKARKVLEELPVRDVISWSALIAGYAQEGDGEQVLNCFEQMQREGLSPDSVTFTYLLKACGNMGEAGKGERIYDEIAKQGLLENDIVLGSAVVDMFAKCGAFTKARQVLEEIPARNVVSWNSLIAGYAQHGEGEQALKCFEEMQREGLSPNTVTLACILKACGNIGAANKGEELYDKLAKQGMLGSNIVLGTALVDMYVKCGAIAKAHKVFQELPVRDVTSWNALMTGYVQQSSRQQILTCFEQMQDEGFSPDAVSLSCMLNACSRLGIEEDARALLMNMSIKYGTKPDLEHYSCMVDLFSRAGSLDKAVELMEKMMLSNIGASSALLSACHKWGDINAARWAFKHANSVCTR